MLILKHLKNVSTCFDHYSDHLQGARRFLVKVTEFKTFKNFKRSVVVMQQHAATSPQLTFTILKSFQFSDFNKEPTSSLKMIRIMIDGTAM